MYYKSYCYVNRCNLARNLCIFNISACLVFPPFQWFYSPLLILCLPMSPCLLDLCLTFTTKLPISGDLFLSKAGPRHLYGNHCSGCVDLQRAWKLFRPALRSLRLYREMERQTVTSTKTDSDVEEVK